MFFQTLRSQIQYKIILPFLLLTLLVALTGSAVSILFITSSAQDRLNNQLAQVARASSDQIVELERTNLQFLREIAFAGANTRTGAPAIADALATHDSAIVAKALDPYFVVSTQRQGARVDRMIAFDSAGNSLIDWEYLTDTGTVKRVEHEARALGALWFVPKILAKQQDSAGDKFAGLLQLGTSERYLFTVAPVVRENQIVGGIIIATRLDIVLQSLSQSSSAAIVSVYRADIGEAFASTQVPAAGLAALRIQPGLLPTISNLELAQNQSVYDTVTVNNRQYQFAYLPLRIRGELVGLLSVALSSDYVTGPWASAGIPLMLLTAVLVLAIVGLGVFVARQITRPLQDLVATAQAVTKGDLNRRSSVRARDEVGMLSNSFNEMTEHLVDLYGAVRVEASQRAAIVESISDGVVVCDPHGTILVMNRAMRELLELEEQAAAPASFHSIPLRALDEATLAFGAARAHDLFSIGGRIVRVAAAPVETDDQVRLGDVYVFQDLTGEVAIDRAKTNFIATISHELRTPLTVLGGSTDLLLRGFVGELNSEQRPLIEAMRKHTQSMTALLNNVIIIAGLESGTMELELAPLSLDQVLNDMLWGIRPGIQAKGLALLIDIPDDLPEIVADEYQLRTVFSQLIDNARRYTARGSLTISARLANDAVRVDFCDTGTGIDAEVSANLFTRFVRGTEGINSGERGIGLGLAIAKMLIERQGGSIWLASTSEHGSTFSVTIPCIYGTQHTNTPTIAAAA